MKSQENSAPILPKSMRKNRYLDPEPSMEVVEPVKLRPDDVCDDLDSNEDQEMWSQPFVSYEITGEGTQHEDIKRIKSSGVQFWQKDHEDVERENTKAPGNVCLWCCWRFSCLNWAKMCLFQWLYYILAILILPLYGYGFVLCVQRPQQHLAPCFQPCPICGQKKCQCKYCRGGQPCSCCYLCCPCCPCCCCGSQICHCFGQ